jgi:hypothetical protein
MGKHFLFQPSLVSWFVFVGLRIQAEQKKYLKDISKKKTNNELTPNRRHREANPEIYRNR